MLPIAVIHLALLQYAAIQPARTNHRHKPALAQLAASTARRESRWKKLTMIFWPRCRQAACIECIALVTFCRVDGVPTALFIIAARSHDRHPVRLFTRRTRASILLLYRLCEVGFLLVTACASALALCRGACHRAVLRAGGAVMNAAVPAQRHSLKAHRGLWLLACQRRSCRSPMRMDPPPVSTRFCTGHASR